MNRSELKRLIKIEEEIHKIVKEEMGFEYYDIEWDIIPDVKMMEIMAYRIPTNISNWKYGRDYERQKTIYDNMDAGLPYEVVLNTDPVRSYLMKSNTLAVQCLVMAHVCGHAAFFYHNRLFQNSRRDILEVMSSASNRFSKYEKIYGIEEVEKTIDAGHAIQFHSSPFDNETEDQKIERIYKQKLLVKEPEIHSEFRDILTIDDNKKEIDVGLKNQLLMRTLRLKKPVEPTEDILRFLVDNSVILDDWQKDILETLRDEGRYYWPSIKSKYANEGFATFIHQKVMKELFKRGFLNDSEHAQFNYANSLVKATNPYSLNPYLVGCSIWEDIEDRWNTGKFGEDYKNCTNAVELENWDKKTMAGNEKIKTVLSNYNDWFFIQEFLTAKLVKDLNIYLYVKQVPVPDWERWIITDHEAEETRKIIVNSFVHSHIPAIEVVKGYDRKEIVLHHKWAGVDLDPDYTKETMKHISYLWGGRSMLKTKINDKEFVYSVDYKRN